MVASEWLLSWCRVSRRSDRRDLSLLNERLCVCAKLWSKSRCEQAGSRCTVDSLRKNRGKARKSWNILSSVMIASKRLKLYVWNVKQITIKISETEHNGINLVRWDILSNHFRVPLWNRSLEENLLHVEILRNVDPSRGRPWASHAIHALPLLSFQRLNAIDYSHFKKVFSNRSSKPPSW